MYVRMCVCVNVCVSFVTLYPSLFIPFIVCPITCIAFVLIKETCMCVFVYGLLPFTPLPFTLFIVFPTTCITFILIKKVKFLKRLPAAAGHCFGPPILASKSKFSLTFSSSLAYFSL